MMNECKMYNLPKWIKLFVKKNFLWNKEAIVIDE